MARKKLLGRNLQAELDGRKPRPSDQNIYEPFRETYSSSHGPVSCPSGAIPQAYISGCNPETIQQSQRTTSPNDLDDSLLTLSGPIHQVPGRPYYVPGLQLSPPKPLKPARKRRLTLFEDVQSASEILEKQAQRPKKKVRFHEDGVSEPGRDNQQVDLEMQPVQLGSDPGVMTCPEMRGADPLDGLMELDLSLFNSDPWATTYHVGGSSGELMMDEVSGFGSTVNEQAKGVDLDALAGASSDSLYPDSFKGARSLGRMNPTPGDTSTESVFARDRHGPISDAVHRLRAEGKSWTSIAEGVSEILKEQGRDTTVNESYVYSLWLTTKHSNKANGIEEEPVSKDLPFTAAQDQILLKSYNQMMDIFWRAIAIEVTAAGQPVTADQCANRWAVI